MLSVGEKLRQERLRRKLTFTQISHLTKIPTVNLKALEKNQFNRLPDYPFLMGMVRNYAKCLGLNVNDINAMFRRDYRQIRPKTILPQPVDQPFWRQSLNKLLAGLTALGLFIGLVGWSLWRVYQPPRLIIEKPVPGQTGINPVEVKGKTDRDASLTVNGEVVNLTPDGRFRFEFNGNKGEQELVFRAESRRHKIKEKIIKIMIID